MTAKSVVNRVCEHAWLTVSVGSESNLQLVPRQGNFKALNTPPCMLIDPGEPI